MSAHMRTVATTADVDLPDRVAFWEAYNQQNLVGLRCMLYHDQGLQAEQTNVDLGEVKVARIVGNAHVIDRTNRHIEDTPKDSIFLTHLVTGTGFFLHSQGSIRLGPGDSIMYDPSRPYLFGFDTDMHKVLVDIPRERLDGIGPLPLPLVRPRGDLSTTHRRGALFNLVQSALADSDGAPSPAANHSANDLLDAVVSLISPGDAAGAAVCAAAKLAIEARLTDLELTVEGVARAVGVSARHLNRLFVAAEEMTVTQYLQRQRLLGARAQLSDPAYAQVRIADIAARWGFSSQSHLTRAFVRQFGCRPSDVRAARPA